MRITNKIMQNNSLNNINNNKVLQDKLNTQMSTQKKITRPSDDPVIAIRALRLRTNVSNITQYYEKNSKDAESWLSITEDALDNTTEVLTDMLEQCGKGANDTMETSDRLVTIENLKALAEEIYATGDADCAGRTVFTGYRTDSKLLFQKDTKLEYTITEQLNKNSLENITYVDADDLSEFTSTAYDTLNVTEQTIASSEVHRIRLAYSSTDSATAPSLTYTDAAGVLQTVTATITPLSSSPNPYTSVNTNEINYIPETGELIIGDTLYATLMATKDDVSTKATLDDPTTVANEAALNNEGEFQITYSKSNWGKGDLRPEHYFACTANPSSATDKIEYNKDYLTGNNEQIIEYDIGSNQSIRVNTTAKECFTHDIGRDVEELEIATQRLASIDDIVKQLQSIVDKGGLTVAELATAEEKLAAAKKAQTLQKDVVQKMFSSAITSMQGYLDQTNLAITNSGSRSSRLELIQNRLLSQQTNFKTLASENEDADIAEVAIQLGSAELAYEAALLATGKISQTSLLNFI